MWLPPPPWLVRVAGGRAVDGRCSPTSASPACLCHVMAIMLLRHLHDMPSFVQSLCRCAEASWHIASEVGMPPIQVARLLAAPVVAAVDCGRAPVVAAVQRLLFGARMQALLVWLLVEIIEGMERPDAAAAAALEALGEEGGAGAGFGGWAGWGGKRSREACKAKIDVKAGAVLLPRTAVNRKLPRCCAQC